MAETTEVIQFHNYMPHHIILVSLLDTKVSEKLTGIVTNMRFFLDVPKLSPGYQTSSLEAFHSVMIHSAPKSTAFSHQGMLARCTFVIFQCNIQC